MNLAFFTRKNLEALLILFFVYICIAPTVRLLLVGGEEMKNVYEFVITTLPDFLFLIVVAFGFITYFNGNKFKINLFDKIILIFLLFNVLYGFILSRNIFISAQGFRVTYLSVIFYFIGRIFSLNDFESLCKKIFTWLLIFGIIGLILHFGFRDFEIYLVSISGNLESAYFIPRIGSLVLMPVLFATLMAIACIYYYYRILKENRKWHYIYIAVLWSCIFLSVSRGPIIAFLLAFIILSVVSKNWKRALITFGIIIITSSLLSFILTGSLTPIGWLFSSAADTLAFGEHITRVELWKHSLHDFLIRPWGYGLGHAGVTAIRFLKGTNVPAAVYTSDGWFLKIACETGFLGLISYLTVIGVFLFKGLKIISKFKLNIFAFIFSVFIMINAQCVVGNTLDFYPYISLYWLMMGFAAFYINNNNEA